MNGIDVEVHWSIPDTNSDGQRFGVYDGKRLLRVSAGTFEWMKTATPEELGAIRILTVPTDSSSWRPDPPEFRFEYRYTDNYRIWMGGLA